jgi:para-nitrobenzyl esterase
VVTINYRIHYLGWLSHSALTSENRRHTSGNYGSLDQIMALNWVRRNIRRFGGDPRRVLVFGQSAGGRNSCVLAASPLARGLISRAAMISSSCEDIPTLQRMEQSGNAYVAKLGCGNAPSVPACLRSKPLADVVLAAVREPLVPGGFQLGPNIDGVLLVEQPLETFRKPSYADFPLLISAAADEVANALLPGFWTTPVNTAADHETAVRALFADEVQKDVLRVYPVANYETPRNTLIQVLTDSFLVCPTRRIARAAAAGGTPVWRAFYTHAYSSGPLAPLGAAHITDMPFWFNNLALPGFIPRESEVNLGNTVSAYLLGFAANGDPNRPGTAMWPRFDPVTDVYLRLDDVQKPASGVRAALCDFWDSVRVAQVAQ